MQLKENERLDDLQFNNLFIIQNKDEYCFTSDAVALANFVRVPNGGKVVDLCSGSGVIGILVNAKNICKDITLVEIQSNMADMSKRSIEYNHISNIQVINAKLQNIHKTIGVGFFDVVTCNPPYSRVNTSGLINLKNSIAVARHEIEVTLEEIIIEADKLLKFGGYFYICNKENRLVDILVLLRKYKLEPKEIKVLKSTKGEHIILVKSKKGGKSGIKLDFD